MPSHQSRCEDGHFRAFIFINLQYCPAIWHHCSVSNTQKLEKNQEPALRYVTNVYKSDYRSFLLCQTSLHSLEEGRQQQIAIQTFKMVNNFSPPYLRGLITPQKFTLIHRNYYPVWLGRLTHLLREAQSHWPPFCFHSELSKNDTRAAYQKTRMRWNWDEYFKCLRKLGHFRQA